MGWKVERRAIREQVMVFISDTTPVWGNRVDTAEAAPMGRTRDISLTGAFIETAGRPPVGATIEVMMVWGDEAVRSQAKVVRHDETGIAVDFIEPDPSFLYVVRELIGS